MDRSHLTRPPHEHHTSESRNLARVGRKNKCDDCEAGSTLRTRRGGWCRSVATDGFRACDRRAVGKCLPYHSSQTAQFATQRRILPRFPVEQSSGITFEDTTSSDNDVNDVRIAANTPQLASMTLQNDGVLHANPNDSPGPFSPDFATVTISMGPEETFGVLPADAFAPDIPEILDDLPSKEVIEGVIRAGLERVSARTAAEQAFSQWL